MLGVCIYVCVYTTEKRPLLTPRVGATTLASASDWLNLEAVEKLRGVVDTSDIRGASMVEAAHLSPGKPRRQSERASERAREREREREREIERERERERERGNENPPVTCMREVSRG